MFTTRCLHGTVSHLPVQSAAVQTMQSVESRE